MCSSTNEFIIENGCLKRYNGKSETVVIPDGVTVICTDAFRNNETVLSVLMPYGLIRIEENAFVNCKNLHTMRLPDTVTSLGIGACHNCPSLKNVDIYPEGKGGSV